MTRYIADIKAYGNETEAELHIKIGALRITLVLSNSQRMALCRALLGGKAECFADVSVAPLALPKGAQELDERTLNARTVEGRGTGG